MTRKKSILFVFLFTVSFVSLFAEPVTKNFDIQGIYGETLSLDIEPIASQVSSYIAGMPFNILDAQVNPDQVSGGRQIARWSAASNSLFTIKVSADHMYHVDDTSKGYPLSFELTFKYNVSVSDQVYENQVFSIESGTEAREFNLVNNLSNTGDGFIGILNGGIFFRFTSEGWAVAKSDNAPDGEYMAIVTVSLKGM